jgi:hypothetical protein
VEVVRDWPIVGRLENNNKYCLTVQLLLHIIGT